MAEPGLNKEDVENLTDLVEGFRLMERYNVAKAGCKKVVDIKERLKVHLKRQAGELITPESIVQALGEILTENHEKNEIMQNVLQTIADKCACLDEHVMVHLRNEGTLQDTVQIDLQAKLNDLFNTNCCLIVTGDNKQDALNLTNLLLGKSILPQCLAKHAATACKISYGEMYQIRVQVGENEAEENTYCTDKNYLRDITDFVSTCCKDSEEKIFIKIFSPLPLLKTGMDVIYFPAYCDSASLKTDDWSYSFLSGVNIFALIYCVQTGTVTDLLRSDKLQNLQNAITNTSPLAQLRLCNPSSVLFVCCCDITEEERHQEEFAATKENIFSQLNGRWPALELDQILMLSHSKANKALQLDYITDDLYAIFDRLNQFLLIIYFKKIELIYWWTETLLTRCLHHVAAYLARTRFSSDELLARQEAAKSRLYKIESESKIIMETLEKQLTDSVETITLELGRYLRSADAQCKIGAWQLQQLPFASASDTWKTIEANIDSIIETRLLNILCYWDTKHPLILAARRNLFSQFKKEFFVLENQLETIDHILERQTWSFADSAVDNMAEFSSWVDTNDQGYKFQFKVSTFQKVATAIRSIISAPISFKLDFNQWRKRSDEQKHLKTYIEDPVSFVHKRSMVMLENVAQFRVVHEYIATQMEPVKDHLQMMKACIPRLIKSNRDLIESIAQDKRSREELERNYLDLEKEIPNLQENLASFGNKYVRKYDYTKQSIEMVTPEKSFLGKTIKVVGIWSEISKALFRDRESGGSKKPVSLKIYIKKVSCLHLQREEESLRRCRHPQIVRFVATFEAEKGVPGFILEPHLVKARRQLFGFKALPKIAEGRGFHMERCRQFLEQVGMGLEYMHYKGLVHMELSLDSVMMLANKDEVKLVNIGEPRHADLPEVTETKAEEFVYLAPEVLNGNTHKSYSDMYSLGLAAWELWSQDKIYKTKRNQILSIFIEELNEGILKPSPDDSCALNELTQACFCDPEKRITSTSWVNEIRKISFKVEQDEEN